MCIVRHPIELHRRILRGEIDGLLREKCVATMITTEASPYVKADVGLSKAILNLHYVRCIEFIIPKISQMSDVILEVIECAIFGEQRSA